MPQMGKHTGQITDNAGNSADLRPAFDSRMKTRIPFSFHYVHHWLHFAQSRLQIGTSSRFAVSLCSSLAPTRRLRSGFSSLTWGQDGTESEVVAVVVGRVEVAATRRTAVERVAAPTAAPKHTDGA